ncbi:MAG: Gfo/Idh/MocA family oxidoreductase [Roseivivax sp.]|nr:Gfo/Idh/MocA family oxidoreductase [Roseivivax sp.]
MKVGLIGAGMVAKTYADLFAKSDVVQLGPVAAGSLDSARAFVAAHPGLGATAATVDQIAADPSVGFAIVTTPPNARREIVETLVRAGKPILMEKPVERTLANATALVEMCEAASVPLGIVLQHRARPVIADLRARLPDLGALYAAEVNVPWWRPQSYYDAPGRGTYARDGGGVLISQAIHTLDLMLTLTGPVADVTALTATTGLHRMEAEDFVCAGLRFASGAVGQVLATTASFPGRGETITLHHAKGSAALAAGVLRIDWHDGRSEAFGQAAASGAGADPMAFTSDWHRAVVEDFAAALREGRAPMVPGRAALEVHRLIAALERSGQTGARVSLNEV